MADNLTENYENLSENELQLLLCLNTAWLELCQNENGRIILKRKIEYINSLIKSDVS